MDVQEIRPFSLDDGKNGALGIVVKLCIVVTHSNSMKTGAGEDFIFVETCLAGISRCANRMLDELGACFAEYQVSHDF